MFYILIIDDELQICEQLRECLVDFGYEAGFILRPELLFHRLDADKVDLILLDINMPGIGGEVLLQELKEHPLYQDIPVIVLTGESSDQLLATCLEAGAVDFLNKPASPLVLKARIKSALSAKQEQERAQQYLDELEKYKEHLETLVQARTAELQKSNDALRDTNYALKNTQEQLIQSAKLASLGEMATGIAHEINQPLFTIRMAAKNLIKCFENNRCNDPLPTLQTVVKQVDRTSQIIEHLRTFGRDSRFSAKGLLDINQTVQDAYSMMSEQLRLRDIEVSFELDEQLPMMICHSIQMEQVFINLLGNARDAMEASEKKGILIRSFREGQWGIVEISDTGTGIPEDIRDKIFDPFFTTKEVGKGTGLGLSITYGIVCDHGGKLEVKNRDSQGASFQIYLPIPE